jgi:peptidase M1-like protein/type IX secretion system substrate protein
MKQFTIFFAIILIFRIGIAQNSDDGIGDTIHAIHYTINLNEIVPATNSIKGYAEVEITSLVDLLDYIPLELQALTTDSVFVNGVVTSFNHIDNRITIYPTNTLNAGDTVVVRVYYHGQPFHENWGGFHFAGDYAFNLGVGFVSIPHNLGKTWFPCIDNFTDRAEYDVIATAETGKTITAGGLLLDTLNNGNNTTTWHWQIPYPIPTYLVSVALGDYVEYKDEHIGIEDTIPISIFTKPANAGDVAGSFVNLHEIISFFETHFGAYPFTKIGYTGTAIGAMEHVSNIAYPHSAINGGTSSEYLYTHELSHMWFGNKVTCSTAEDMWLNEGWATFCDIYYKEVIYDHETFITEMRETHKYVLQNVHVVDGGYWAVNNIPQDVTYGKTAYDKGGTVVNTLRNYLGDSVFFESITAYLNAEGIAYNSVSSSDMRDFLTDYTGINMTPFFNAWVMSPGTPHFSLDSIKITEGNASYMIDVWSKQKYKGFDFLADDNIIEVTFADKNFNLYTDTIHFSGKNGHSVKIYDMAEMPNKPVVAFIDLFEKTNDATTDNTKYFSEPEEYEFPLTYFTLLIDQLNDSSLVRVTHNWVAPDSLKIPVEGLRLSPYRHWKIEGILSDSFRASGKFFYNISGNLDNGLITSIVDSVVILYRETPANKWSEVPQTRIGVWTVGNIFVDEIKPGEYTLAVWDTQIVNTPENNFNTNNIKIYPNPSSGKLNFEFPRKGNFDIHVFNESGILVDNFMIYSKKGTWKCNTKSDSSGFVMVKVVENGETLLTKKIVLINNL